jgi:hypothetical protein
MPPKLLVNGMVRLAAGAAVVASRAGGKTWTASQLVAQSWPAAGWGKASTTISSSEPPTQISCTPKSSAPTPPSLRNSSAMYRPPGRSVRD